jgi:hypothetical protein
MIKIFRKFKWWFFKVFFKRTYFRTVDWSYKEDCSIILEMYRNKNGGFRVVKQEILEPNKSGIS